LQLSAVPEAADRGRVQVSIRDIAFGGDGVGTWEGKAVFIPFTIDGEEVTADIVRQKKKHATADLVAVEKPSSFRTVPQCPYFHRCGGCSYQHISYQHQLEIKQRQVEQTLRRVGRFNNVPMRLMIGSPKDYGYRNRIRVHASEGTIGFFRHDRHELIDIEHCPIASEAVNVELAKLRRSGAADGDYVLSEKSLPFFEQTNPGATRELVKLLREIVGRDRPLLIDAYCGAGFFAKQLRDLFDQVIGIEQSFGAVAHARVDASPGEQYLCGDVAAHLAIVLAEHRELLSTLILDPPAIGVSTRVVDHIFAVPPAEIIYVSCDPGTLARDLAALCRIYHLQSVTPLDMFPQTAEIEVIAHLTRN
jgi:tRNA/tmRNA/rRNA uracil-C5-methylase (TrmA/RlmC/RlmD family)